MNNAAIDADTLIVGLGKTGLSVARHLARAGAAFAVFDTRAEPPASATLRAEMPQVALYTGMATLGAVNRVVLSPGVPRAHPLVAAALARGIPVHGDIELFAALARRPIVAVTGSNGKSTVVTMVAAILEADGRAVQSGGNLGTPALDLLAGEEPDIYVLELSSFQLESVESLAPAVSCILNISPDHMDRYRDVQDYAAAKQRIATHAACVVVNRDDPIIGAWSAPCPTIGFSARADSDAPYRIERNPTRLVLDGEAIMAAEDMGAPGEHNLHNALAAIAITDVLGVRRDAQRRALAAFRGLPHRTRTVAVRAGIEWIDDSKGTNVGATCAAINGVFAQRHGVLIAGGEGKGADFAPLGAVVRGRVHSVVLIGTDAARIAAALGDRTAIHFALDMTAAVTTAAALARPGEAVLLSPACASFDMFTDYAARGDAFAEAVMTVVKP